MESWTTWSVPADRVQTRGREPHLVTNPADDDAFRRACRSSMRPGMTPDGLAAALQDRYPATVVHRRELAGERSVTWYVYRDGHWTGRSKDGRVAPSHGEVEQGPSGGGPAGDL